MLKKSLIVSFAVFIVLLSGGRMVQAQADKKGYDANALSIAPAPVLKQCVLACRACEKACVACNRHCVRMMEKGMTQHEKSRRLSADCRELCRTAALLSERKGPMAVAACRACADACDA